MSEERLPVQTVCVDYVCDSCGEGHMRPTGLTLTSHPPQYPHLCDKCAASAVFTVIYPQLLHVTQGPWKPAPGSESKVFSLAAVNVDAAQR